MTDKLRVFTDKLTKAVETCLKRAEREDAKAAREHAKQVAAVKPAVVKALTDATARARRGELPNIDGYSRRYHLEVPLPDGMKPPQAEHDTREIDRIRADLATLKASSQGSVSVEPGDKWSRYLREADSS